MNPRDHDPHRYFHRWDNWDNNLPTIIYVFVCVDKTEFTKEYYGQPFTSRQHLFERLCEKAQVDKFGFHAIRHLTATQLYKQGRNVAEIQRVLRHTSPNTTVRYLKTLGVDDIRTAMDSFQATCKEALD